MIKSKNVPKIRFKEFSGEWEEKELGDITSISMGQSPNGENYTDNPEDYILVQGNADMQNGNVVPRVWTTQVTKIADVNDLIISVRAPVGEIGKTAYEVVIGRGVAAIKGNEFVFQYLKKMNDDGYWEKYSAGSTFDSINSDALKKAGLFITIEKEQKLIGSFFRNVDDLISKNEQQLTKLKNIKKGCLEKMFPKKGATVPEIRFKGFTKEWEERKLDSMTTYKNGKGHEEKQSESGKYELINLNSISIDGGLKPSGKFIDETTDTLIKNDLVMVLSDVGHGDLLGRVAIIPGNNRFVLNQRVALLRPNETIYPDFLFFCINAQQRYFKLQGVGSSQLNISKECVETFSPYIPCMKEQKVTATFFTQLDTLIAQNQQQLTKLKNIKKACLEKMFVNTTDAI